MSGLEISYFFGSTERGLFTEIYLPKRAAYYGAIYDALRFGYNEKEVKGYMREQAENLLNELRIFPFLFDSNRYNAEKPRRTPVTPQEALERIEMYKSHFRGWSVYPVDGVFFDKDGNPIEEATQIIRIMFRFESSFVQQAIDAGCADVLRAILFWVINQQGRLEEHRIWSKAEQSQFIARHRPWPKHKEAFVKKNFFDIVREVGKWIDDCQLFVFGYLVRKFWERVVEEKLYEEEIWVASFYNLIVSVVKRT